jgi:hypothetical protein
VTRIKIIFNCPRGYNIGYRLLKLVRVGPVVGFFWALDYTNDMEYLDQLSGCRIINEEASVVLVFRLIYYFLFHNKLLWKNMRFGLNDIFIHILFNLTRIWTFEPRSVVGVRIRLHELRFKEQWFDSREAYGFILLSKPSRVSTRAHPASCWMGEYDPPRAGGERGKRPMRVADHSHYLVPSLRMSGPVLAFPHAFMACTEILSLSLYPRKQIWGIFFLFSGIIIYLPLVTSCPCFTTAYY